MSQGCFLCTLFSALILCLAENNYSGFVRRCDVEGQQKIVLILLLQRTTPNPGREWGGGGRTIAESEKKRGKKRERDETIK